MHLLDLRSQGTAEAAMAVIVVAVVDMVEGEDIATGEAVSKLIVISIITIHGTLRQLRRYLRTHQTVERPEGHIQH